MSRTLLHFFAVISLCFCQSALAISIELTGVSGAIKKNIELRLNSLWDSYASPKNAQTKKKFRAEAPKNILSAMQPFGFYQPDIRVGKGFHFIIRPGKPVKVSSIIVHVSGPGKHLFENIQDDFNLSVGDTFTVPAYEAVQQSLFTRAENLGFIKAELKKKQVNVNLQRQAAQIELNFNTGKRYYFGKLTFANSEYDTDFLHRYAPFYYSEPFSAKKLLAFNRALSDSGYFSDVSINPNIGKKTHVPIHVKLTPKHSKNYSVGIGFGTDTGVRGRLGWNLLRVTNTGHTFKSLIQASQRQNSLQLNYTIPGKNPAKEQYTISANVFDLDYPVGNSRANQLSLRYLSHYIKIQYQLGLNLLYETFNFVDKAELSKTLFYPDAELTLRKADSPIFSKQGYNLNLALKGSALITTEQFVQAALSLKYAHMILPRARLYLRAMAGYTAIQDIYQLPLSLQLLAGGSDSLRAYNFQSVGPGKLQVVGGTELQLEVVDNWYALGLIDIGDVYIPSQRHFRRSIGAGVMYVSPIGPIKIGIARALDRPSQPFRLLISIGPDL